MKRLTPILPLILVLLTAAGAVASPAQGPEGGGYVCPMDCEHKVYEANGRCPVCGMRLVPQSEAEFTNVAILVFDGVQVIDFSGPYEVFMHAGFRVYTVAADADPIRTVGGMQVIPAFTIDDAPRSDVVVIPGGSIHETVSDPRVERWILGEAPEARHVMSVCNGAFILAKTGLLDGLEATTVRGGYEDLRQTFKNVTVVEGVRWVDNGKIITSGGLSTGIDTALHVVSKMLGEERAERIARGLEFRWEK